MRQRQENDRTPWYCNYNIDCLKRQDVRSFWSVCSFRDILHSSQLWSNRLDLPYGRKLWVLLPPLQWLGNMSFRLHPLTSCHGTVRGVDVLWTLGSSKNVWRWSGRRSQWWKMDAAKIVFPIASTRAVCLSVHCVVAPLYEVGDGESRKGRTCLMIQYNIGH